MVAGRSSWPRRAGGFEALRHALEFGVKITTEEWLGEWTPGGYDAGREGWEGQGVLHGTSWIVAPRGGFRRGASKLGAPLDLALGCSDSVELFVFSDGALDNLVYALQKLRALRHMCKEAVPINVVVFGTWTIGHNFLLDVASASKGEFVVYTEACGLPQRFEKVVTLKLAHKLRIDTLKDNNAQTWAHAVVTHTHSKNAILVRNNDALQYARNEFLREKARVHVIKEERVSTAERVRSHTIPRTHVNYSRRSTAGSSDWKRAKDPRLGQVPNLEGWDRQKANGTGWVQAHGTGTLSVQNLRERPVPCPMDR